MRPDRQHIAAMNGAEGSNGCLRHALLWKLKLQDILCDVILLDDEGSKRPDHLVSIMLLD